MGVKQFFKKKWPQHSRKKIKQPYSSENVATKNGPLVLAVTGSILAMICIAIADVRLIRDPSTAGKIFQRSFPREAKLSITEPFGQPTSGSDNKSCYVPPEVTFYKKLSALDESGEESLATTSDKMNGLDCDPGRKEGHRGIESDGKHIVNGDRALSSDILSNSGSQKTNLPEPEQGARSYAVQVGAFTHPAIAQEWALKWKTRGYDVVLKPVARPKAGVIYRLYLGSFVSQKQADELVKHLKSKEGISAFPVVLRN